MNTTIPNNFRALASRENVNKLQQCVVEGSVKKNRFYEFV